MKNIRCHPDPFRGRCTDVQALGRTSSEFFPYPGSDLIQRSIVTSVNLPGLRGARDAVLREPRLIHFEERLRRGDQGSIERNRFEGATEMTWLVTGGAGYIGSHIVRALQADGRGVVVLDDLSTGYAHRIPNTVPFIRASVLDEATLVATIRRHRVTGVVHLAGKKRVDESVLRPMFYHQQNVLGVKVLLRSMRCCGVNRIVFSSSCAVYGDAEGLAIDESAIPRPVSPYGRTKLTGEQLVQAAGVDSGMQWISLRYFNVAGAGTPALGDAAEVNLIPMTFRALAESRAPHIFGGDYPTPDGTCVRDYIHVSDVVDAHLAAVERLERGRVAAVYNVGRGSGVSVREIMTSIADVTGRRFDPLVVARRPGDPASVVASAGLIEAELGWTARLELSDIIRSAWAAWAAHDPAPQPECVVADG